MAIYDENVNEFSLKNFRKDLTMIIGEVQHGKKRVRVTSYGRTAGYFISEDDMRYLEELEDALDIRAVEELKASGEDKNTLSWREAQRRLEL